MTDKRVIERLMDIMSLLLNRDDEDFDFDGLDIEQIADILKIDVQTVKKDIYSIYAATRLAKGEKTEKKDFAKGGIYLDINDDAKQDYTEEDEGLIDAFYDDEKNLTRNDIVGNDKYNKFKYCINTEKFTNPLYVSLTSEQYDSLVHMLAENGLSERYINMDAKEYYRVCPEYNDYSPADKEKEDTILEAIRVGDYISFDYNRNYFDNKWNVNTIKPLKVVRHTRFGYGYVVTIPKGKNEIVSYRIDKMKDVNIVSGEDYDVDMRLFDKLPYMWSMDFEGEFDVRIKVYNDNDGKVIDKVMRDLEYHRNENGPVYNIEKVEDGIIMSGHVIGRNAFLAWLRSYGASVEVLEPQEFRDDIIADAKKRLELYS